MSNLTTLCVDKPIAQRISDAARTISRRLGRRVTIGELLALLATPSRIEEAETLLKDPPQQ